MAEYKLTPDAENDLREIARYTTRTWGAAQTRNYKAALLRGFTGIAKETVRSGQPLPHRPDVRSCRCEHHYVFSIHKEDEKPVIVAVLHENMDLIERLRKRLEEE
jgi:plasmid stabilization system protein ParE